MPEIFSISDAYTVLRDGAFIQSGLIRDIDEHKATEMLIGKNFTLENLKDEIPSSAQEKIAFSVKNLSGETFHDVSFDVHKGEIVVFTGLQGSGTDELATALFGASPVSRGEIIKNNKVLNTKTIKDVMKSGIAMIPRNRKERGIVPHLSIQKNNSLAFFVARHKKLVVSQKEELERFERNRVKLDVKVGNADSYITSLSGGNQQKIIFGKWLEINADVFIMDNPTQGIDVGAKFSIYKLIHELARQGNTVIVFSNEYPEIHQLADRCMVMYQGKINGVMNYDALNEIDLMKYSTGLGV
jgi:ribose transport system ATP-binding protein